MVVNRKTRSKPAAGAARTAGKALEKSTSAAEVVTETIAAAAEPIRGETVESGVAETVEPIAEPTVEPTIEPTVEPTLEPDAEWSAELHSEPIVLEAEVVADPIVTESIIPEPIVPESIGAESIVTPALTPKETPVKATPAKTIPTKATQKTKGASPMTESETPKTNAIAKVESTSGFVGMIYSAGERPIGASSMQVFGTILNGRPIEASSVKLFDILPGDRPVFSNEVTYVTGGLPGGRPVMVSPAGMLNAGVVMGYRPIFSNDDVSDPNGDLLMGYLD
jgi:hypothetical protein